MKIQIALVALLIASPAFAQTASARPASAAPAAAPFACTVGSVAKTYGATPWTVHACDDGHSIAIVANPGSKASPCTFIMQYQSDGSYEAHGRCSGDRPTTQAAFNDIGNLNAGQVKAIYDEAAPAAPAAPAR